MASYIFSPYPDRYFDKFFQPNSIDFLCVTRGAPLKLTLSGRSSQINVRPGGGNIAPPPRPDSVKAIVIGLVYILSDSAVPLHPIL